MGIHYVRLDLLFALPSIDNTPLGHEDMIPDVRDGLNRRERIVLYVLHQTQKEQGDRNVPSAMLWRARSSAVSPYFAGFAFQGAPVFLRFRQVRLWPIEEVNQRRCRTEAI